MMTLTPQSMRSPVSPCDRQSKYPFSVRAPCYSTAPQPEPNQATPEPNRGLGLFDCNFPKQQSTVQELPPSPQPSDGWPHNSLVEQDVQFGQPPDISTPAYDAFHGFFTASSTGMLSASSPEAPGLICCQTPQSTLSSSHRSSISSSCSATDGFQQHNPNYLYTPRVKAEGSRDWYPSDGSSLQKSLNTQGFGPYSNVVSPISTCGEEAYRPISSFSWPHPEAPAYPADLHTSSDTPRSLQEPAPILPSVTSMKKKRQRTTPDEATHECQICGKLFKRSYNWKSHMETHNPDRKYPHPCTAMNGTTKCTKKFQRKTDLDRHVDSVCAFYVLYCTHADNPGKVHRKIRNHECDLCGSRFARRDTLRRSAMTHPFPSTSADTHPRHTEDGCPKRFELGFREGAAAPGRWSFNLSQRSRPFSLAVSQPSLVATPQTSQSTMYQPLGRSAMSSSPPSQTPIYAQ